VFGGESMRAQVFIDHTTGGLVEVSVVKHGLSSGVGHKYHAIGKAKAVLLAFGFDAGLVDCQLEALSVTPPSVLLQFPVAEIADDVLRSFGFDAAAFQGTAPRRRSLVTVTNREFQQWSPSDCDEQGADAA
jgi:hypothetical protein